MRTIPKIIHYCWFGKNPFSKINVRCIDSWKKYCPDYKMMLWNEDNYNINKNIFIYEAFKCKKWAFVSDYLRLDVLSNIGGIYLDTDCEILQGIDSLIENESVVTGYQEDITIPAALIAAEPNNVWINKLLSYYDKVHFVNKDGSYNMTTNSFIITAITCKEFDFKLGDNFIKKGHVRIYPSIYFAPYKKSIFIPPNENSNKSYKIDKIKTYAIHHAVGSWTSKTRIENIIKNILGILRIVMTERIYTKIKGMIIRKKLSNIKL